MPRLDNSSKLIIEWYSLPFDENDPAMTPLVDLCYHCFKAEWDEFSELEIDHPEYEYENYICHFCNTQLTASDNYYNL